LTQDCGESVNLKEVDLNHLFIMMKVSQPPNKPEQQSIGMIVLFFILMMGILAMMILKGGV
jgi:cytochrome c1